MINEIKELRQEIEAKFKDINSLETLENFRLEFLVKKGKLQAMMDRMREVPKEDKPVVGKELNILRKYTDQTFREIKEKLEDQQSDVPEIDLTLPGRTASTGSLHPVKQTIQEMTVVFEKMGFKLAEGPEIEDGFHNFDALNFPPDHPARDMQDTFFIEDEREIVLRTHTSPVQIRLMQNQKPPIRSIMPGRVYRNEALDATHLAEFHQIEGLYIDENVSFSELKATMMVFATEIYGNDIEFRFRPSFFPFTEPSAELDIRVKGSEKWMEVAGCGMVHPNVLKAGGIDPEKYTGYAFGFGIERITMLKTKINDIRLMYENDVRVLKQF
jgi:phenylalanyl-tRNA synthetase alpha chain